MLRKASSSPGGQPSDSQQIPRSCRATGQGCAGFQGRRGCAPWVRSSAPQEPPGAGGCGSAANGGKRERRCLLHGARGALLGPARDGRVLGGGDGGAHAELERQPVVPGSDRKGEGLSCMVARGELRKPRHDCILGCVGTPQAFRWSREADAARPRAGAFPTGPSCSTRQQRPGIVSEPPKLIRCAAPPMAAVSMDETPRQPKSLRR